MVFKTSSDHGQYEQADGIELTTNGYKMAWSVTDYLSSLEKRITQILEEEMENRTQN